MHVLRGAVGGLVATAAMTVQMLWAERTGRVDRIGPDAITGAALDAVGVTPSPGVRGALTTVAHLGYGIAAGAAFGAAAGGRASWRSGVAYGSVLALAGYQGWVPALGIVPPLTRAPSGRRTEVLGSHLIYGSVLGAVASR